MKQDCTVRATAACLGITYAEAHAKMKDAGRGQGRKVKFWGKAVDSLGLERRAELACRTLASILPEMQSGRFIVRHARHVFAVVNGVVIDMGGQPSEKLRTKMVYEYRPKNSLKYLLTPTQNSGKF